MKTKRLATLVMAGAMTLSLAAPAFASGNTTNVTGTYKDTPISVVVPETGLAFINPYGLDIKVPTDGKTADSTTTTTISGQQIVTAPMAIKNQSAMNLKVNVSVKGTVPEGSLFKFATSSTKGTGSEGDADYVAPATTKSAFVYLQAKSEPTLTGAASAVTDAAVATAYAAWGASAYDADKDVVIGTRDAEKEGLVELRPATLNADGTFKEYKAGGIALIRLTGDCVTTPRGAGWAESDKFSVAIAYTFNVVEAQKYTITKNNPTSATGNFSGDLADMTVEVDKTSAAEGDTVTVSITYDDGTATTATVTVKDADNGNVAVTPGAVSTNDQDFTFTMPAKNVTIDIEFADV